MCLCTHQIVTRYCNPTLLGSAKNRSIKTLYSGRLFAQPIDREFRFAPLLEKNLSAFLLHLKPFLPRPPVLGQARASTHSFVCKHR